MPEALRERTHEIVRKQFPEIRLQIFGDMTTDGYRPPVERQQTQPYFEQNITHIMAMGIATHERALQVLEANQNNLETAINILLALQ